MTEDSRPGCPRSAPSLGQNVRPFHVQLPCPPIAQNNGNSSTPSGCRLPTLSTATGNQRRETQEPDVRGAGVKSESPSPACAT
jgi:hypothetical protein